MFCRGVYHSLAQTELENVFDALNCKHLICCVGVLYSACNCYWPLEVKALCYFTVPEPNQPQCSVTSQNTVLLSADLYTLQVNWAHYWQPWQCLLWSQYSLLSCSLACLISITLTC